MLCSLTMVQSYGVCVCVCVWVCVYVCVCVCVYARETTWSLIITYPPWTVCPSLPPVFVSLCVCVCVCVCVSVCVCCQSGQVARVDSTVCGFLACRAVMNGYLGRLRRPTSPF